MKNSNDTIGNRTRDIPVCSAVPPNAMSTGVKWQGRDADHAPSTAKVKNELSYTSTPIRLHDVHGGNFTRAS